MATGVCLEKMEIRWIAHVSGLPGCFSSHTDREIALRGVPEAVYAYLDWCAYHGAPLEGIDPAAPVTIEEIISDWVHPVTEEAVEAFFAADAAPLRIEETTHALDLFDWTRTDLLAAIEGLPAKTLDQKVVGEWSIGGIFFHTLRADWWYLNGLGMAPDWTAAPREDLPELLDWVQASIISTLPRLAGVRRVAPAQGALQLWSPRKFLRRALWHRRDHIAHIYQFREQIGL